MSGGDWSPSGRGAALSPQGGEIGARGEVGVVLGGVRRRVCLTLGALAEIETGLAVEGLAAAAELLKALSARDLIVVLAAVLRGGGETAPDVAGVEPREAARAVAAAFEAAAR